MNPGQLRVTTMDPDTRRLVQLVLDDSDASAGTDEVMNAGYWARSEHQIGSNGLKRVVIWRILLNLVKFQSTSL